MKAGILLVLVALASLFAPPRCGLAWESPRIGQMGQVGMGRPGLAGQTTVWKGRWTSDATPNRRAHGGTLRVRLRPGAGNTQRGTFYGRFAVVIPYFYRATVHSQGGQLVASKRLGPMGQYDMVLVPSGNQLSGRWWAGGHTGSIELRRR